MKIAVCDDEVRITNIIKEYLEIYYNKSCQIDIFRSGNEMLMSEEKYTVLFLDIEMGDMNGIELAEKIREKDTEVIIVFVTNYADYSRRAFKVHAFDYILKPIEREQIFKVLDEIALYKRENMPQIKWLKSEEGMIQVSTDDILYFEYVDRKVKLVSKKGNILLKQSLTEIQKIFEEEKLVMPHRAFLVQLSKVKSIKTYDIVMENGDLIPIAQKKASVFRKELENYLFQEATRKRG